MSSEKLISGKLGEIYEPRVYRVILRLTEREMEALKESARQKRDNVSRVARWALKAAGVLGVLGGCGGANGGLPEMGVRAFDSAGALPDSGDDGGGGAQDAGDEGERGDASWYAARLAALGRPCGYPDVCPSGLTCINDLFAGQNGGPGWVCSVICSVTCTGGAYPVPDAGACAAIGGVCGPEQPASSSCGDMSLCQPPGDGGEP